MQLAIYTKNFNQHSTIIEKIKSFFQNEYTDIFICTSLMTDSISTYACLPEFYLKFFNGYVVFLNVEDFLEHSNNIIGSSVLFIDKKDVTKVVSMNKLTFKQTDFLTLDDNDNILRIKNYDLQQIK